MFNSVLVISLCLVKTAKKKGWRNEAMGGWTGGRKGGGKEEGVVKRKEEGREEEWWMKVREGRVE